MFSLDFFYSLFLPWKKATNADADNAIACIANMFHAKKIKDSTIIAADLIQGVPALKSM